MLSEREKQLEDTITAIKVWLRMEFNNKPYVQIVHGVRSAISWLDDDRVRYDLKIPDLKDTKN